MGHDKDSRFKTMKQFSSPVRSSSKASTEPGTPAVFNRVHVCRRVRRMAVSLSHLSEYTSQYKRCFCFFIYSAKAINSTKKRG